MMKIGKRLSKVVTVYHDDLSISSMTDTVPKGSKPASKMRKRRLRAVKVSLDNEYLKLKSFWFDIKIIWLTFLKVIQREGVLH